MVQRYLFATRSKGGLISSAIAIVTAKALIARYPEYNHGDLDSSSWAKSLFKRMAFVKRMSKNGKVEIPEGAKKTKLNLCIFMTVTTAEENKVPSCFILNLDQTSLKYIPVGRQSLAKTGSKSVSIAGSTDKRSITGTFIIFLSDNFLPMQLIYGGKTKQFLPRFKFPESFSLSANPKHFSNKAESLKVIKEIILPYVKQQRQELEKPDQPAILIMDVFRNQMTEDVVLILRTNNIWLVKVPNNMTHLLQSLDLTVNGHCKPFMKGMFAEWYRKQVKEALSHGKQVEDIEIKFYLTVIKPLHAKWLMQFFNHITSEKGSKIIINGWKRSGIYDAVKNGSSSLPSIDPFNEIDPLVVTEKSNETDVTINQSSSLTESFVNDRYDEESDCSDWENENDIDFERSAFDTFIIDDE